MMNIPNTMMKKKNDKSCLKISNITSFFLGVVVSIFFMRNFQSLMNSTSSSSNNNNDNNVVVLPNHIDATKVVAHTRSLNDAMTPGRGYQPTKERYNTKLPEAKGSYWWLNNCGQDSVPEAFGIAALDMTYPEIYFTKPGGGHPNGKRPTDKNYIKYIHRYASLFLNRKVESLVEFGNGGGYYAEIFSNMYTGDNFVSVEGTGAGYALTLKRGIPKTQVVQHDLRHPIFLGRRFDVAVCTEVVEHVEPPFAAQIVLSLVLHSDIIWFSYKPAGLNNGAWINHPNERPFELWKNLFDFYGYDVVKFNPQLTRAVVYRGDFMAYKRDNKNIQRITEDTLFANLDKDVLDYP